ncbi:TPA: isopentenyl-diphosphate Delta-isomerase, partial [Escherichia coli]|nr:isopentenyl-diphosphate Delta-isomerase [Escherichia coli]
MKGREYVLLLNEKGEFIGTEEKYDVHTTHPPLHQAFSCWLFNSEGQVLITRRSLGKKAWPGVWTNSVCGHPQLNESFEQAITRRCHFEVGAEITDITPV